MRISGSLFDISSLVSGSLRAMELDGKVKEQTCLMVWDSVVGEQMAKVAQPEFVRDGCLFVITKSSVWANELTFYKKDIITKLNARVGVTVIKEIVFKVGKISRSKRTAATGERSSPNLDGIKLTDEELKSIDETIQVSDEETAEALKKAMRAFVRMEKWKKAQGWTPCSQCGSLQNAASGTCPVCR